MPVESKKTSKKTTKSTKIPSQVSNTQTKPIGSSVGGGKINFPNRIQSPTRGQRVKAGIKHGIRQVAYKYKRKMIKARPMKKLGKFVAMGIGGATLGAVGLAAGISQGDASKTLAYTAGGFGVGAKVAGTMSDNVWDEGRDAKEAFQKGYYGEEEYKNRKLDKEFFQSGEFVDMLNDDSLFSSMHGREREKAIRSEVQKYRSSGITDSEKITKAIKLAENRGLSTEQVINAMQLAKNFSRNEFNDPAVNEDYYNNVKTMFGEDAPNIWSAMEEFLE